MPILTWLSLVLAALLALLFPLLFSEFMLAGLAKLHIAPEAAMVPMIAIIVGGMINIPVKRIIRQEDTVAHPFGLRGAWPVLQRVRRETEIAVNLGGCVIPTVLAIYQLAYPLVTDWPICRNPAKLLVDPQPRPYAEFDRVE